jgi:hypothetical protein
MISSPQKGVPEALMLVQGLTIAQSDQAGPR